MNRPRLDALLRWPGYVDDDRIARTPLVQLNGDETKKSAPQKTNDFSNRGKRR